MSATRGRSDGNIVTSTGSATPATSTPRLPATVASATLSVSTCALRRARVAPRDRRVANSRALDALRIATNPAALAQATNQTSMTAPQSARSRSPRTR